MAKRALLLWLLLPGCSFFRDFATFHENDGSVSGDGGPCVPVPETCDGRDDDCDGIVDNNPVECSFPNAIVGCVAGQCAATGCVAGYSNCDSNPDCELATSADRMHCGGCMNACALGETCSASACVGPQVGWVVQGSGMGWGQAQAVGIDGSGNTIAALTSSGDLTIGSHVYSSAHQDLFVAQVAPDGTVPWQLDMVSSSFAQGPHVAVNDVGISVIGFRFGGMLTIGTEMWDAGAYNSAIAVSLNPAGGVRWVAPMPCASADSYIDDVAMMRSSDTVFLVGMFANEIDYPADPAGGRVTAQGCSMFLARLEGAGGTFHWAVPHDWCTLGSVRKHLGVTPDGGLLYVASAIDPNTPASFPGAMYYQQGSALLASFQTGSGAFINGLQFLPDVTGATVDITDMAFDSQGNVVLLMSVENGSFTLPSGNVISSPATGKRYAIVTISQTLQDIARIDLPTGPYNNGNDEGPFLDFDGDRAVVAGIFGGQVAGDRIDFGAGAYTSMGGTDRTNGGDGFVIELDARGNLVWSWVFGSTGTEYIRDLAARPGRIAIAASTDDVVMVGGRTYSATHDDPLLIELTTTP